MLRAFPFLATHCGIHPHFCVIFAGRSGSCIMTAIEFLDEMGGDAVSPRARRCAAEMRRRTTGSFPFRRRLRIEALEDRRLLTTITVDTLADGIGVPGTSLREALAAAGTGDTINFSVTGQINLSNDGLAVTKS